MEIKKRFVFIDALRGLTMLFVVYHHIIIMGMRDLYISDFDQFFMTFLMPLFFFIGGFVTYKTDCVWNFNNFHNQLLNKVRGQLIPTIVWFLFCILYFHLDLKYWLFQDFKSGYWFTWVYFQIFTIYAFISVLSSKINDSFKKNFILILSVIVLNIFLKYINLESDISRFFSLQYTLKYYIWFIIGILAQKYILYFNKFSSNPIATFIIFVVAVGSTLIEKEFSYYVMIIIIFSRLVLIYLIFKHYQDFFDNGYIIARGLSIIGKHTLEIYFLHYFLLFKVPAIANLLNTLKTDYCFRGHSCNFLAEFFVVGVISVLISFTCILIRKIIDAIPLFSEIGFGPRKKMR